MYRLMIVDDSTIIRNRIQRIYNADEFMLVTTATNGIEAIEQFDLHRPNVITMDLTMPHMDGIDCIPTIMAKDPSVRILVISALSDKATGLRALKLGARGFLIKPFSEEELADALNEIVSDE